MKLKVAVVQDAPVFFEKDATLQKVETIVKQYAKEGCNLIVFPESFVPGYPRGFSFGATIGSRTDEGRQHYADYYNNSFDLDTDDLTRLETLSKEHVYRKVDRHHAAHRARSRFGCRQPVHHRREK